MLLLLLMVNIRTCLQHMHKARRAALIANHHEPPMATLREESGD